MFNVVKADVLFKFVIRKAEREAETGMEQWSSSGWEDCCRCAVSDMPEVKGNDPAGKTAEDVLLRTFKTNSLTYYAEHFT